MANGEIVVSSASSGVKFIKSGFKNLRSTLSSKIKSSKDEFTLRKSKDKVDAEPVASKDDHFNSRQLSSKNDQSVETLSANKDDHYIPNQTPKDAEYKPCKAQEDDAETAAIANNDDQFIPKSQRGDSDGDNASMRSGKSSLSQASTTDSDSLSLASTQSDYVLKTRSTDLSSISSISGISRKLLNDVGERPTVLHRVKTALSFSRKSSLESEGKNTVGSEKQVIKNNAKYEKRHQETIDAIDKRNTELNNTVEKVLLSNENFRREMLKLASTDKIKPLVLKKGQEKVQEELLEKGIQSVTIREDMIEAALKGVIAGKAEKEGMTTEEYLGKTSLSAKGDAFKESFSTGTNGVKVVKAQSDLTKIVTNMERAGKKHDIEPERPIHPDDLNRDTCKPKGRLLAYRRSERFPTTDSKAGIEDAHLSPKEKAKKQLAQKQERIAELDSRVENYDAKPLKAALDERDALQVRTVFDAFRGVSQDWKLTGNILHGRLGDHPKISVDEMNTVEASEKALIHNVAKEVAKNGNAEKMLKAQLEVERRHMEIGPDARELKALKSEQNLAKAQNAHIDEDGDTFYDPFEHSFQLRVGIEKSEKNILPLDLEKSRIDMAPKGIGEVTTRALPELGRRFKNYVGKELDAIKLSNAMPGAIPGQPVMDDALRNMPAAKPKRMATEEELNTISGAFREDL